MFKKSLLLSLALILNAAAEDVAPWPSGGCGKAVPFPPIPIGVPNVMTVKVNDTALFNKYRDYVLYLPPDYDPAVPLPVVFYFPSFYITAESAYFMDKLYWLSGQRAGNFIVVTPNGMNDCNQVNCQPQGLATVGWNTYGTGVDADGPLGPTCNANRVKYGSYPCYSSCRAMSGTGNCTSPCVSASCSNDTLFFETVLADVQSKICVDDRRIYVTGMSVGAMLALEISIKYAHLLAGAVPAAAGVLYGYWKAPTEPIPFMDIHGLFDDTIPANVTNSHRYDIRGNSGAPAGCGFSSDGFYYVPSYNWTRDIAKANKCAMDNAGGWNTTQSGWKPWKTAIDGQAGWQCGQAFGECPQSSPLVRCTWNGVHELPLVGKRNNYSHQHIPPNNLTHTQKVHAFATVAWEFLKPLYRK